MKSYLLIFSILLMSGSVLGRSWHIDSKESHLELEVDTTLNTPLIEGDHPVLQGHFCLKKETPKHCQLLTPEDLSKYDVKFFYPDVTQEVTSAVTLTLKDDRHEFAFEIPAVVGNENPVFTAQIINKGSKVEHYQRMLAKFRALKAKLLEKKTHWPKAGKDKINQLTQTLQKIEARLLLKLQGESALIAKREFPLQIKNNISQSSSWINAAEEWQVEVTAGLGVSFEGEKTWIDLAFTPYVTNTYDWKLEYILDGFLLSSKQIADPTTIIQEKFLSESLITGSHELKVIISKNEKTNKNNPKWEKSFEKIYSILTLADPISPVFSNILPAPGRYVSKNLHSLSYTATDPQGRIDVTSIKAIFDLQDGTQLDLSSDLNYLTNGQVLIPQVHGNQEGSSSYIVSGSFTNLPEGTHHLSLKPQDFAGNEAQGAAWTFIYDRTSPFILLPFSSALYTNELSFSLPITVTDLTKTFLKVYVNGILQLDVEATDGTYTDELAIELVEGANLVRIEATDEAGNSSHINYPAIFLDSLAPTISSINLENGQLVRTKQYTLSATASEPLLMVTVNGEEIELSPANPRDFAHLIEHMIDGNQRIEFSLTDLAGNTSQFGIDYQFLLKLLDPNLIAVLQVEEEKLKIVGYPGATHPGLEISGEDGFFNTDSTTALEDGSFELNLDTFRYAKVTAFDSSRDRGESAIVSYVADTTLAGTVKDIYDNPLPGVTITIVSSGQSVKTDTNGNFAISNPSLGDQKITIDGRSIPVEITKAEKSYSIVSMNVSLGNKQKNIIERPIYLAHKILDGSETVVAANSAVTVSSPHAMGVEIQIPANAATFPGGSKTGSINMMEIPAEKTSVELLEMAKPDTVIALEPSGLKFSQRVDLTLPNNNEFPEGTELVILSKNSETGNWEVDGSATVEDNMVKTKPGEGISHFSEVYASPFGMEIKSFRDGDKPNFDTMNGSVSTSISLPSFKSMGQDVAPGLIYNSNWANPNVVISNIFDLPRKRLDFSSAETGVKDLTVTSWITPEYIDAQFTSSNVTSEKKRFLGMPDKSLVSYQIDLGELPEGIHPAKSSYEIRFKNLSIFTQKYKAPAGFLKTKTKYASWEEEKLLEKIFPQELVSTIYHQNKKQSEFGSGWRLNLAKKILNPEQDRIMLEYENGEIGSYTLKNTMETVQYDDKGLRSFAVDGTYVIGVNMEGSVLRTSNGSTNVTKVLPPFQGQMGVNTSWYSHYSRKCTKSGYKGCRKYEYSYYYACNKFKADYNHHRKVKSMLVENGNLVYLDQTGALFGHNDQEPIAGEMALSPYFKIANNSTSEQSYQPYCTSTTGGACSTTVNNPNTYLIKVTHGNTNTEGWCNTPGYCFSGNCTSKWTESSGFMPQKGSQDGLSTIARFNQPMTVTKGFRPDSYLVADYGNNLIRMVDVASNSVTAIAGNQKTLDDGDGGLALSASIYHPRGLVVLSDGSYLISSESGYIRRVTTDGKINSYIGKPTSKGGVLTDITDMKVVALNTPSGMVYDQTNEFLYIADTGHNRILRIDLETEEARVVAGNGQCVADDTLEGKAALDVALCRPEQIALDSQNNLLVLDEANKRVRRINFVSPDNGLIRYQSLAKDNSELLRNQDGSFILKTRDGKETLFSAEGLELSSSDRVGRTTSFSYDGSKRLTQATLPTGQQIQVQYSGEKISSITDAAGKTTQFNFDGDHLASVSFPDGTERSFDYNEYKILTQETNQRGIITKYILNGWNRLSKIMRADGSSVSMEDAVSKTIANDNDQATPAPLKSFGSDQDSLQDLISDAKGNTTTFIRDTNGYVQEIKDAKDEITKIERDSEGRPTKIIKPNLTYTELEYAPITGDLLRRFESDSNLSEKYSYNQYGQLLSYIDPLNNSKSMTYDPQTGLLVRETDPNGNFVQNTYNSMGLILTSSNKLGQTTTYSYSSEGNVNEITAPMGEKSTFVRDNSGNVISKTNAKTQTTEYSFDPFNRLLSVKTPGNFTTSYTYLATGELSLITNPEGHGTTFEYDELGRLIKKTSPKGQVTRLFYDNNDNVIKEITPKGDEKIFTYDITNQLIKKTLPDDVYNFSYDTRGNLVSTSNDDSSFSMTYVSILGRDYLKTVTTTALDIPSHVTTYGFNAAGRRTSMSSNYLSLTYSYDSAYRMTGLTNSLGKNFSFGYDEANRLSAINRPNDVNSSLTFDNNSFLKDFTHKKGSAIIENFIYTRDQIGNRITMTTTRGGHVYGYDNENQLISASHPEADELHALENFSYDSLGNRTADNQGGYSYDDKKFRLEEDYRYLYVYDLNGNLTSKQEKGMSGKVWNYAYNSENQMIQAELYDGTSKLKSVQYFYDAMGRRIKKSVQDLVQSTSHSRKYVYGSTEIIAELDEDNSVLARYTHSGLQTDDVLSVDITSDGVSRGLASVSGSYLYLKDGLGSVQAITTETGNLVQRYIYSSFGKLLKVVDAAGLETNEIKTAYTYTNREFDEETGLYYYRARYYDPARGQFLTEDPDRGEAFSPLSFVNKYTYANNGPTNFSDPLGLFSVGGYFTKTWNYLRKGDIKGYLNSKEFALKVTTVLSVAAIVGGAYMAATNPKGAFILASAGVGGLHGGFDAYDDDKAGAGDVYNRAISHAAVYGAAAAGAAFGGHIAVEAGLGAVGTAALTVGAAAGAGAASGQITGVGAQKGLVIGVAVGTSYYYFPGGPRNSGGSPGSSGSGASGGRYNDAGTWESGR